VCISKLSTGHIVIVTHAISRGVSKRSPSKLRQTTRECVYFRLRNKYAVTHSICHIRKLDSACEFHNAVFYRIGVRPIADWSFTLRGIENFALFLEYRLNSYMKVIGSRSRSQEQKKVENPIPQCKTYIGNNSGSIKYRAANFAYITLTWSFRLRQIE